MGLPNTISLKEHFDQRIADVYDHVKIRFEAREKAAIRELAVLDERLDKANGVHAQFTAQYAGFTVKMGEYVSRNEFVAKHDSVRADIHRLEDKFSLYTTTDAQISLAREVQSLRDWRANINGRIWAGAGVFLVFQVIITLAVKTFFL